MSNEFSPYVPDISEGVRQHMEFISICRDEHCPVPNKHPFYPLPDKKPLFSGPRPCMPVVPARLAREKVMILGAYPACRFATIKSGGHLEQFIPVRDFDEPFEDSRYFDGYNVREFPSGAVLMEGYFRLLGLDPAKDLWITNMVKCFLFKQGHVNAYERVDWNEPPVAATRNQYFEAAAVCIARNLERELELCKPKLVIALGEDVCRMIHRSPDDQHPAPEDLFENIIGQPLRANTFEHPRDSRNKVFKDKNVFHMYHPGLVMREDDPRVETHFKEHIPAAREFLAELGLVSHTIIQEPLTDAYLASLKPFAGLDYDQDMHEIPTREYVNSEVE